MSVKRLHIVTGGAEDEKILNRVFVIVFCVSCLSQNFIVIDNRFFWLSIRKAETAAKNAKTQNKWRQL